MRKLRFALTNILFWAILALSCFLAENISLANKNYQSGFETTSIFIMSSIIIGFLVFYYFLEHKKNGLRFDKILLLLFILFGILTTWISLRFTSASFSYWNNEGEIEISFTIQERIIAVLKNIIWLAVLYAAIFVNNRQQRYRWIAKAYLLTILIMVIVDFFMEMKSITSFLDSSSRVEVAFLFGNANIFALFILSGIITALILSKEKFNWLYFVIMLFLCGYLFLTRSSTSILIGALVVFGYATYEAINYLRTKSKKAIICSCIYGFFVIAFVSILIISVFTNLLPSNRLISFIRSISSNKDFSSFASRKEIWKKTFELLSADPINLLFGFGYPHGTAVLQTYFYERYGYGETIKSAHNGIIEMILRYGLVGGFVYICLLLLIVFCLVLHIKKKRYRFAFLYGLAFIAIMLHSITESTTIFTPNIQGMYFGMVFALPILNVLQEKHFKEISEDEAQHEVEKTKISSKTIFVSLIYFVVAVIVDKFIIILTGITVSDFFVILIAMLLIGLIIINKYSDGTINKKILYLYRKEISYEE